MEEKSNYEHDKNYVGDHDLDYIISYLGEEKNQENVNSNNKKKKKSQPFVNKKEEKRKEKREDDSYNKDDHKKEDSGGGGKGAENISTSNKNDVLAKEIKINGIVTENRNISSTSNNNIDASAGAKSSNCDTNHRKNTKLTPPPVDAPKASCSNGAPNTASKKVEEKSKKSKKGKTNQTMRESSSVEDLVSKCKMSEQISVRNKQHAVDDGEVNKKRSDNNANSNNKSSAPRRNNVDDSSSSHTVTKNKKIEQKDATASKPNNSATTVNNSNLNRSKRLSSSNTDLGNVASRGSDFGRDFYEAGDPYSSTTPSTENLLSSEDFELVTTRRKNKKKHQQIQFQETSPVGAASLPPSSAPSQAPSKARYNEENVARDGYRDNKISALSSRYNTNSSSKPSNINSRENSFTCSTNSGNANIASCDNSSSTKKQAINFDEAPRTIHDGEFMARLSSSKGNSVGGPSDPNTTNSAPNSDCYDSDGEGSVKSMPSQTTTSKPTVKKPPPSSDTTPQASYANIAKMAHVVNRKRVRHITQQEGYYQASLEQPPAYEGTVSGTARVGRQNNINMPSTDNSAVSANLQSSVEKDPLKPASHPRHAKTRSIPDNLLIDNFPPLSCNNYRQTSLDRDLGNLPGSAADNKKSVELVPFNSEVNYTKDDKESSPTGNIAGNINDVRLRSPPARKTVAKPSVKESTPEPKSNLESKSVQTLPNYSDVSPISHNVTSPSNNSVASPEFMARTLLTNSSKPSQVRSEERKSFSEDSRTNLKGASTVIPIQSKEHSDPLSPPNNNKKLPTKTSNVKPPKGSKDKKKHQHDPVIFVNQSIPADMKDISFMSPSTLEIGEEDSSTLSISDPNANSVVVRPHSDASGNPSSGRISVEISRPLDAMQLSYHPPLSDEPKWLFEECQKMIRKREYSRNIFHFLLILCSHKIYSY